TPLLGDHGRPAEVLEIGYGTGAFAEACTSLGWRYTGLEPLLGSGFPAPEGRPAAGIEIVRSRFEEWTTEREFDLVVLDNVLEHLPRPVEAVRKARRLVRAGGLLWIQVPNEADLLLKHRLFSLIKRRTITFPGHVNLFT